MMELALTNKMLDLKCQTQSYKQEKVFDMVCHYVYLSGRNFILLALT